MIEEPSREGSDAEALAELEQIRQSIDNIDAALIHLLAERFKFTQKVGRLKAAHGLPPADLERESRQIARLRALAEDAHLDPAFAEKFLGFIVAAVVFSATMIWLRLPQLRTTARLESLVSREATFLYNNLLLVALTLTILWGVAYPILSEAVRGEAVTVGRPYYDFFLRVFGLPLLLLMGIGPLVAWRRASLRSLLLTFAWPLGAALGSAVDERQRDQQDHADRRHADRGERRQDRRLDHAQQLEEEEEVPLRARHVGRRRRIGLRAELRAEDDRHRDDHRHHDHHHHAVLGDRVGEEGLPLGLQDRVLAEVFLLFALIH